MFWREERPVGEHLDPPVDAHMRAGIALANLGQPSQRIGCRPPSFIAIGISMTRDGLSGLLEGGTDQPGFDIETRRTSRCPYPKRW